jgi:hypothetical protein
VAGPFHVEEEIVQSVVPLCPEVDEWEQSEFPAGDATQLPQRLHVERVVELPGVQTQQVTRHDEVEAVVGERKLRERGREVPTRRRGVVGEEPTERRPPVGRYVCRIVVHVPDVQVCHVVECRHRPPHVLPTTLGDPLHTGTVHWIDGVRLRPASASAGDEPAGPSRTVQHALACQRRWIEVEDPTVLRERPSEERDAVDLVPLRIRPALASSLPVCRLPT